MANELFCLKWNNYTSNIITELDSLRTDGDLVDVTILCDGRKITAHKVILSACSSYFRTIFRENPCQHPVVILKDINYEDIEAVLCFVYQGTVYISKSRMDSFLKTAESLQIKGLAGASNMMGDNEENRNISSEETNKIVKRSKPVPPLASVSTNVPAATSSIPRNSPINNTTLNKRRKLFPNNNQVEDSIEDDSHHMSTIKIQNEDSRSLDSSATRPDRHSSSVAGIDKDSIDQDDESNTYNNTAYSSTGEVDDDNQMQYTDDNEDDDDDDDGETSDSISQTNSISTQSSGQAVQKRPRGSSRDIKEESPPESFTNSNLNIHIAMENPPAPAVIQPPLPLGEMIKTETISPTNSPFYNTNNTLPTSSPGIEPTRTPAKKIGSSGTENIQGSPADFNRGQQSFTEEELPAERLGRRPCPLCLKIISNKSNLLKHIRIRHNTDYYDQAKCPKCYKNFKNKYSLRAHINIYHKENHVQTPSNDYNNVKEDQYSYSNIMEPPPMIPQPSTMNEQYYGIMSTTNLPNLAPESMSLNSLNSLNSQMFLTQSLTSPAMSSTS